MQEYKVCASVAPRAPAHRRPDPPRRGCAAPPGPPTRTDHLPAASARYRSSTEAARMLRPRRAPRARSGPMRCSRHARSPSNWRAPLEAARLTSRAGPSGAAPNCSWPSADSASRPPTTGHRRCPGLPDKAPHKTPARPASGRAGMGSCGPGARQTRLHTHCFAEASPRAVLNEHRLRPMRPAAESREGSGAPAGGYLRHAHP